ncbi:MAG TPA: hypothetical protein PLK77_15590 [Pyrinomonadaceae bacterium]|nr:hypothetical protein [Pyrinomonadaceae bacterium]
MSKTKLDARLENALNAFFETEPEPNRFELAYCDQPTAIASTGATFSEKANKWSGILRELLMFGPGTFALFYMTLAAAFFFPAIGLSFQGLFMLLSAAFLTYAGSGSLKSIKNLTVPLTVIVMALAVVSFSLLFFGRQDAGIYFWYSIYLFPLVLIAAKLVQNWVADKE